MKRILYYLRMVAVLIIGIAICTGSAEAAGGRIFLNSENTVWVMDPQGGKELLVTGNGRIDRTRWNEVMRSFGIMKQDEDVFDGSAVARMIDKMVVTKYVELPADSSRLFEGFKADLELNTLPQKHLERVDRMFCMAGDKGRKFVRADFSGWEMGNIKNFEKMFYLASVRTLDMEKWDTKSAENMDGMFYDIKIKQRLRMHSYPGYDVADETKRKRFRQEMDSLSFYRCFVQWKRAGEGIMEATTSKVTDVIDFDRDTEITVCVGEWINDATANLYRDGETMILYGNGQVGRWAFLNALSDPEFENLYDQDEGWSENLTKNMIFRVVPEVGKSIQIGKTGEEFSPFRNFRGEVRIEGPLKVPTESSMYFFFAYNAKIRGLQHIDVSRCKKMQKTFYQATVSADSGLEAWKFDVLEDASNLFEGARIEEGVKNLTFPRVKKALHTFLNAVVDGPAVSTWKFPALENARQMFEFATVKNGLSLMEWGCPWERLSAESCFSDAQISSLQHPYEAGGDVNGMNGISSRIRINREQVACRALRDRDGNVVTMEAKNAINGPIQESDGVTGGSVFVRVVPQNAGFRTIAGQRCFVKDGKLQTALRKIGSKFYFFDRERKGVRTGWITDGSRQFYGYPDGSLATGRTKIGKKWYFFGHKRPTMLKHVGFRKIGNHYYHFEKDHSLRVGWLQRGEKRYYMKSNAQRVSGFHFVGSKLYFFGGTSDPYWRQNRGFHKIGEEYYHYDQDHSLHRGWLTRPEGKYFMDGKGRRMHGFRFVRGKLYCFGAKTDGKLRQLRGFRKIGKHYYHYDKDHSLHRGWMTRGDKKYYMNGKGVRAYGFWTIDGKKYYFGSEKTGYLRKYTGWKTIDGKKYYFNKDHSVR